MMQIKTNVEYLKCESVRETHTDSQSEYTLPDYNSDVRKILYTSAQIYPSGKFVGDGEIEFSGIIVYNLIYSDPENKICSISFTSDYDYAVKCDSERYKDCICDARVANYAIRVVGPRRISAKASVSASVRMCEEQEVVTNGSAFSSEETPEVMCERARVRASFSSGNAEREYAESIAKLEGAIVDEVSVIYTGAEVVSSEAALSNDGVMISGNLKLSSVIKNGEEPAYLVEKNLPIDEKIAFEGVSLDMALIPELSVSSLKANVNPDDSGCEVVLSAILEMHVRGERNQDIELISDAYMKECEVSNSYDNFTYTELCSVIKEKRPQTVELSRSELDSAELREVVFISATPRLESVISTSEGVRLSGELKYAGVALEICDDGSCSYIPLKFSTNFEENVNIDFQNMDKMRYEVKASCISATATLDADKLYASADLCFDIVALSDVTRRIISSSEAMSDISSKSCTAQVVVYYPDSDDTLFSVAKRYRTTVSKLARDNSIDVQTMGGMDASLGTVKRLLIYS